MNAVLPPVAELRRVVPGTDCSEAAAVAEARFIELVAAGANGVPVCAIERGEGVDREREQSGASAHVEKLKNENGGQVSFRVQQGLAAQAILQTSREVGADLIIVGKRGHDRMHELFLGSTAEAVCRGSGLPVPLVPGWRPR